MKTLMLVVPEFVFPSVPEKTKILAIHLSISRSGSPREVKLLSDEGPVPDGSEIRFSTSEVSSWIKRSALALLKPPMFSIVSSGYCGAAKALLCGAHNQT